MTPRRTLRAALRPLAGREQGIWRRLRSPALRYLAFSDALDCLLYGLLISLPRVRFLQIGANDGRTDDPLWTFRRYPHWSGILVEPADGPFRRLSANYAPWSGRFTLVKAAVGAASRLLPLYHFPAGPGVPAHLDQVASLDEALVLHHRSRLAMPAEVPVTNSQVRCVTFAELCHAHDLAALNVLVIDAEGSDAAILAQVDLTWLRPELLLFEHVHLSDDLRATMLRRLGAAGYETFAVGHDTLGVAAEALQRLPLLRRAWRLVRRPPARV
jgi:FkbM family methyltransferase